MNIIYDNTVKAGDVVAVGDIHGRFDLYELFLDHVKGSGATVILLGDMIDRARTPGDDMRVLNKTRDLLLDPESWGLQSFYVLRGNHEKMFMDAVDGYGVGLWAQNGGDYQNLDNLAYHEDWISQLPIYMTVGETMFVHAGIYPGHNPAEAIADGEADELVWMREPFLTCGPQLKKWTNKIKRVVHGHTPYFENDLMGQVNVSQKGDRIGIDSGAYFTNVLTSYNATRNTFTQHTVQ